MLKYCFESVLENNRHIYVLENSAWDLKGRYNLAIEDNDDLDWVNVNGEDVTSVLVVMTICVSNYLDDTYGNFFFRVPMKTNQKFPPFNLLSMTSIMLLV